MNAATEASKFTAPQLNDGEVYAGALIKPDGTGHHIILLPGDNDDADWQTQMDWAKSIGGDLPSRPELVHLYAHLKQEFQPTWYWSNEQHESDSDDAWSQTFISGYQVWHYEDSKLRARAVRRLAI